LLLSGAATAVDANRGLQTSPQLGQGLCMGQGSGVAAAPDARLKRCKLLHLRQLPRGGCQPGTGVGQARTQLLRRELVDSSQHAFKLG
jgi:hypothetical protein